MTKKRGRPLNSRNIRVTPEYREKPDISKLGLVFLEAARQLAKQNRNITADNEGNSMP